MKKKKIEISISRKEVLAGVRLPLPTKIGGRHKDRRDVLRQENRVKLKKGEW